MSFLKNSFQKSIPIFFAILHVVLCRPDISLTASANSFNGYDYPKPSVKFEDGAVDPPPAAYLPPAPKAAPPPVPKARLPPPPPPPPPPK